MTACAAPPPPCVEGECVCVLVWRHLVFDHGTEVVVPEEDAHFPLFGSGVELAQAVIGQLSGRRLQEVLGHQTCTT